MYHGFSDPIRKDFTVWMLICFLKSCLHTVDAAQVLVFQNSFPKTVLLNNQYLVEAKKVGDFLYHSNQFPSVNYLLLWSIANDAKANIINASEAKKVLEGKFNNKDKKLPVKLLNDIKNHLQRKRNCWEKKVLNDYEMELDLFYSNVIFQLDNLIPMVEIAVDSFTVKSIIIGVYECLRFGWFNNGDGIGHVYSKVHMQFIPLATEKIAELKEDIKKMRQENMSLTQQIKNTYKPRNSNISNNNNNSYSGGFKPKSKTNPIPVPPVANIPASAQFIPGTKLLRIEFFCDWFQRTNGNCTRKQSCYWKYGHKCSSCGDKKHGRSNCPNRPANWA